MSVSPWWACQSVSPWWASQLGERLTLMSVSPGPGWASHLDERLTRVSVSPGWASHLDERLTQVCVSHGWASHLDEKWGVNTEYSGLSGDLTTKSFLGLRENFGVEEGIWNPELTRMERGTESPLIRSTTDFMTQTIPGILVCESFDYYYLHSNFLKENLGCWGNPKQTWMASGT